MLWVRVRRCIRIGGLGCEGLHAEGVRVRWSRQSWEGWDSRKSKATIWVKVLHTNRVFTISCEKGFEPVERNSLEERGVRRDTDR